MLDYSIGEEPFDNDDDNFTAWLFDDEPQFATISYSKTGNRIKFHPSTHPTLEFDAEKLAELILTASRHLAKLELSKD